VSLVRARSGERGAGSAEFRAPSSALRVPRSVLALLACAAVAAGLAGALPRGAEIPEASLQPPDLSALLTSAESPWLAEVPGDSALKNAREAAVVGELTHGKLHLRLSLGAPARMPIRASVYLVNRQGWFYKSAQDYLVTHHRKTAVVLDLGPDSADLVPAADLARPWSATGGVPIVRVGVGLYSPGRWRGPVEVSEARVELGRAPVELSGPPRIEGLTVAPARPAAGAMVELAFGFPASFANPFDPAEGQLDAELAPKLQTGPDPSPAAIVPAYFDQSYLSVTEGFAPRAVPVGPPRWKVRLCPRAPGEYAVRLRWRGLAIAEVPLSVGPAAPPRAARELPDPLELRELASADGECFLRRLAADPGRAAAVLRDGRFWPVGPKPWPIAGWIAPLEWTDQWGGWLGAGRYNLEMADRLDTVLARAAARGVRLPLFINYDGPFSESDKYRWQFNPLAAAQGGPLQAPSRYYRDQTCARDAEALFRYLAARYANHPAVDGLVLAATLGADGVEDWHDQMAQSLARIFGAGAAAELRVTSFHPLAVRRRQASLLGSFEPGAARGWRFDTEVCPGTKAAYSTEAASEGRQSLRVEADFPGELCLIRSFDQEIMDAGAYDLLTFDVFVPKGAPAHLRAMIYLRDREFNWYEELLPEELRPGDWTRLILDLRPGRNGLCAPLLPATGKPAHGRPWDGYSRQRLRALGLRLFASREFTRPYKGPVYLDNIRLLGDPELREEEPKLAIADLKEPEDKSPALFTRVEYVFGINRTFANPFDPECVEVRARVLTPSGQLYTMPGFFDQGYRRADPPDKEVTILIDGAKRTVPTPEGAERLEPEGPSRWKVRLAAAEPGVHQVALEVLVPDGQGKMVLAASRKGLAFEAAAGTVPGYVRPAADGRHFEHSSGEFFYPIGMALRSPSDARDLHRDNLIRQHVLGPGAPVVLRDDGNHVERLDFLDLRGTHQFDDYFKRCGESGMNWARVWMAPWWLGLEWDHRYPGYEGAGRYNLANAWRLDHVLEAGEKNGVYLQLCLTNHGQVTTRIDRQWDFNPYNAVMPQQLWNPPDREAAGPLFKRPGGFLNSPRDWFTDPAARKLVKQRLRYIVARWGYSPKIMAWGLMSEVEFTGGTDFRGDNNWDRGAFPMQTEWHQEMARYLRTIDPYRHLVTTHFSHPCNGTDLWRLNDLDYVQSNAYSSFRWFGGGENEVGIVGAPNAMHRYFHGYGGQLTGLGAYKHPVLIGEWGGYHMHNSMDMLDSELHSGLWAQAMIPMGGATGFWWWLHVHYRDRYGEFAALSRFMKGEDLRSVTAQLGARATVPAGGGPRRLEVLAIGDGQKRAYAWAYAERIAWGEADKAVFDGARAEIDGLVPGRYEVEFWNPARGERVSAAEFATRGGPLSVTLPKFQRDLALKIRWKAEPPPASPPPPPATPPARASGPGEKGVRNLLCAAPEGPFRQKVPDTFFSAEPLQPQGDR